jgi:hypothetical protein
MTTWDIPIVSPLPPEGGAPECGTPISNCTSFSQTYVLATSTLQGELPNHALHGSHLSNYLRHRLGLLVLQVLFRRYRNLPPCHDLGRSSLPNTLSPIDNPDHGPNPQRHVSHPVQRLYLASLISYPTHTALLFTRVVIHYGIF